MKKLLPIVVCAAVLFAGCSSHVQIPHVPSIKFTSSIDYSKFGDFFLTESNSVSFPYEPIASIQTVHIQGVDGQTLDVWTMKPVEDVKTRKTINDDVYGSPRTKESSGPVVKNQKAERVTLEETLKSMVNEAKALGANGVINLKITMVNNYQVDGATLRHGYEISGMAIKR